jgi:hypothetical protein
MLKLFTTTDLMVLVGSVVAEQSTNRASRAVHAVMGSEVSTTKAISEVQALTNAAVPT